MGVGPPPRGGTRHCPPASTRRPRSMRAPRAHEHAPPPPRRHGRRGPHHTQKSPRHPLPPRQEINLECGSLLPLFHPLQPPISKLTLNHRRTSSELSTVNFQL